MARKFMLTVDPYVVMMVNTVIVAILFPATGHGTAIAEGAAAIAIGGLFFMYGAKLSPEAALTGLAHWRLHGMVLLFTYGMFPVLGLGLGLLTDGILPRQLYNGLIFLCVLPSTVQSSIAFTSIARGNVAAAICSASASNIIGIFATPLLAELLMDADTGFSYRVLFDIVVQLLLPFMAGQMLRSRVGHWLGRNKSWLGFVDRGSILLVIYTAFSAGMVGGVWDHMHTGPLGVLLFICIVLLVLVLWITTRVSRRLGFSIEDEIVLVFCGSKKSLASGLPIASVLFPGPDLSMLVIPLMLFHQLQLMLCAALAQRYSERPVHNGPTEIGPSAAPTDHP